MQGGAGCHDADYVSMWGNQAVGESIQEPISLQAGHHYVLTACVRFHPDAGKVPTFVNFVFRGSNSQLSTTQCPSTSCETFATTSNITSQSWVTVTACFTPLRNESILTVSPSNGSNVNDGSQVSFGQIDDICIREIQAPVIEGPKDTCTSPATYCVKPPASGPFNWTVDFGTFQPANADGSCILVTWNPPHNGAVHVTSTVEGCPFKSDLNVAECNHPSCCKDHLNVSLVSSEIASGGMNLNVLLSGPQATTVKATILGASHVQAASCGTSGPITATASGTQPPPPPPPPGWNAPVAPFLNGNQVVWQAIPFAGSPLGQFAFNVQLPPSSSFNCNDKVTVCIEFEVTFAGVNGQPCRTCTIVKCFTFTRCPACAKPSR